MHYMKEATVLSIGESLSIVIGSSS